METEKLGFQAEVKQLLQLMIHSLYSNKEIFLRELISNASDACDKLRFEALKNQALYENDAELKIRIEFDSDAGTVAISDNGIGMSRQDVVEQLGTIAKSGTSEFLQQLSGDQKKDAHLIGQFGVGFYSAFIVAERVEVSTRRAGLDAGEGVHWESDGEGEFSVASETRSDRGTTVVLHLKADEAEFADALRLRTLVSKFSDHIAFPVVMPAAADGDEADSQEETLNTAKALWTRPRSDVSDEEYQEFYRHVAHDAQPPLIWSHNKVEGKRDYTSLLYIPGHAPFDLWHREAPRGLKLYVQRVFILDDAEQFLPLYLRFVRGIIDSNDLSLNVSREMLQSDAAIDAMRAALTKRVLGMLAKLAQDDVDKYLGFWREFGAVLKEGSAEDFNNREKIAALLRFSTTTSEGTEQDQSLADYVGRMQEGQDKIYYLVAESLNAAPASPHLEVYRKNGIEVLLLYERVDEWLVAHLQDFDGKMLHDIARGELDLGAAESEVEKQAGDQAAEQYRGLLKKVKRLLGERVELVRFSRRLTDSPACLVMSEGAMGAQMRRILEATGQQAPEAPPVFELNSGHPLIQRLDEEADEERFADLTAILFDQATLAEGSQLQDPADYLRRLNKLLLELTGSDGGGSSSDLAE